MADTIKKNKNETIMYAEPKNQTIMYADPKITRAYKTSLPAPSGSEQIGKTKLSYFGDERGGVRKPASRTSTYTSVNDRMAEYSKKQAAKKAAPPKAPARKLTKINVPGGGLRTAKVTPTSSKPKQMGINRATGSTLGFTTGKTTGSTATKSGVAGKTKMSGSQRMAQNAFNKGGVAGPRKDSSGRNVSSASGKRK